MVVKMLINDKMEPEIFTIYHVKAPELILFSSTCCGLQSFSRQSEL